MVGRRCRQLLFAAGGALAVLWCLAGASLAADPAFNARVDRTRVGVGEAFAFEVTLSLEEGRAVGYRAPDFRAVRVLGEYPSQSTQIQMGAGGSFTQTVYSWRYELVAQEKGELTLGAARVRVAGRELRTTPITITVADGPVGGPRGGGRGVPGLRLPVAGGGPASDQTAPDDDRSFIRVVPSQLRAYVGQQVTVEWSLYLTERQDKYQPLTEPRTDGFWSEDLPLPGQQRGLALSREDLDGRTYLVAPLMKKALFPLHPGKLNITPLEAEISQVDFFGSTMRTQRLKAEPLAIEVSPLPTSGRPADFDPAAVGRFSLSRKVDRDRVSIGEAVTLTLVISGKGNLRKVMPPKLGALEGWKTYDPKVTVTMDPGDVVSGRKTIEYLLLPERPGVTVVPALTLPFFDPELRSYVVEKTQPVRLEVSGEQASDATAAAGAGGGKGASALAGSGVENVLPLEIRPLRSRSMFRRDLGTTFHRSRAFAGVIAAPPLLFVLTVLFGRVRERLNQDTEGARRRRLRRLARRRLRTAERHLQSKSISPFVIEIDRVLRDFLSGKLGRQVAGLSRDELRALMSDGGLSAELVDKVTGELEACDRARFAPGSVDEEDMRALLDEATETILQIGKAALRPGVKA